MRALLQNNNIIVSVSDRSVVDCLLCLTYPCLLRVHSIPLTPKVMMLAVQTPARLLGLLRE